MTEVEIAKCCVDWMKADGWEVYQEACVPWRADIVAVKDGIVRVIEAKTRLSFELAAQGMRWKGTANEVYLLTPAPKRAWDIRLIMQKLELGWIEIYETESFNHQTHKIEKNTKVRAIVKSPVDKEAKSQEIIDQLDERMKDYAPAGSSGSYWTPFKRTRELFIEFVRSRPEGVTSKEVAEAIKHHYATPASARSNLLKIADSELIMELWVDNSKKPSLIKLTSNITEGSTA